MNPLDYLSGLANQARAQLSKLDPQVIPQLPNDPNHPELNYGMSAPGQNLWGPTRQPPQIMQGIADFVNKANTALDPVAGLSHIISQQPGVQKFTSAHPQISEALSAILPNLAGALTGSSGGSTEAGMNSLPISTLIKLAQKDTKNALAPTIHDVINARNEVYHATGNYSGTGILDSGQINPGMGDQFEGVATSRVPVIPEKSRQLRFAIDPDKMPPSIPTADSGYGKTTPTGQPGYAQVFQSLSKNQFDKMKQETKAKYLDFDDSGYNLNDYNMSEMSYMANSPTFLKQFKQISGPGRQNPDFEYETRTKNKQPISTNAIKQAIISTPLGDKWDSSNIMGLYKDLLESKNPVPATLIKKEDLPLLRVIMNKTLSQQVLGGR